MFILLQKERLYYADMDTKKGIYHSEYRDSTSYGVPFGDAMEGDSSDCGYRPQVFVQTCLWGRLYGTGSLRGEPLFSNTNLPPVDGYRFYLINKREPRK